MLLKNRLEFTPGDLFLLVTPSSKSDKTASDTTYLSEWWQYLVDNDQVSSLVTPDSPYEFSMILSGKFERNNLLTVLLSSGTVTTIHVETQDILLTRRQPT